MRALLNVIWLVFGGLWLAILYTLAGILAFILIITIPFGFAAFRMARFCLWPFGRTLVKKEHIRGRARSSATSSGWCCSGGSWRSLTW